MVAKPFSKAFLKAPQNVDSISILQDTCKAQIESDESSATTSVSQTVVVGTYVHEDNTDGQGANVHSSIRKGSALLLEAERTVNKDSSCSFQLTECDEVILPAVLDVQSCASRKTVYAACAQNKLYALDCVNETHHLQANAIRYREANPETMILSLDVFDTGFDGLIATSDTTGAVGLHRISENGTEEVFHRDGHCLEAWSACINRCSNPDDVDRTVVYSGGDDGTLCAWRSDTLESIFRRRNAHDGVGVTTVTTHQAHEHKLWSGGYDDTIRIWDVRSMRRCVEELNVGGGVWRVKFHPHNPKYLLVAAMYDGCKALHLAEDNHLHVVAQFDEHKSIAYGASWLPNLDSGCELMAMTGSFYDQAIHIWSIDMNNADGGC